MAQILACVAGAGRKRDLGASVAGTSLAPAPKRLHAGQDAADSAAVPEEVGAPPSPFEVDADGLAPAAAAPPLPLPLAQQQQMLILYQMLQAQFQQHVQAQQASAAALAAGAKAPLAGQARAATPPPAGQQPPAEPAGEPRHASPRLPPASVAPAEAPAAPALAPGGGTAVAAGGGGSGAGAGRPAAHAFQMVTQRSFKAGFQDTVPMRCARWGSTLLYKSRTVPGWG